MKQEILWTAAILATALSYSATAAPIQLAVIPTSSTVATGSTTTIDLTISGLGAMSAPSLSAFDLNLLFDPALLSVSNVSFGSSTPPYDQLNLEGFGTISGSDLPSPGRFHLYEVSFDDPTTLDSQQRGAFTLAELTLTAMAAGNTLLNLAVNTLGDSQGNSISGITLANSSLTVTSSVVAPEPKSALLMGMGAALLILVNLVRVKR